MEIKSPWQRLKASVALGEELRSKHIEFKVLSGVYMILERTPSMPSRPREKGGRTRNMTLHANLIMNAMVYPKTNAAIV